jgi:hypothetical protein
MSRIAILGGTGAEGEGLSLRLALAGHEIVVGSRQAGKAAAKAASIRARLDAAGCATPVEGRANAAACDGAEIVFLALPFAGIEAVLASLSGALADKLVVDVVNPLRAEGGVLQLEQTPAGSAAETIRALLPGARLVSAFKTDSAERLKRVEEPLEGDVLVCSDEPESLRRVTRLVEAMPNLRAIDAGPLANARYVEAAAALLLDLNRRHRAVTALRILGLG